MSDYYEQLQERARKISYKRLGLAVYGLTYGHFFFWPIFYLIISYIPWLDGATLTAFLWTFLFLVVYFHYRSSINYWAKLGIKVLKWKRSLYA